MPYFVFNLKSKIGKIDVLKVSSVFYYAPPQKVAKYYVIPSELLSVRPSVRPFVSG